MRCAEFRSWKVLEEYGRVCKEETVALVLGKGGTDVGERWH